MIRNYDYVRSIDELRAHFERIHGSVFGFDIESGYLGPDREKGAVHPETAIVVGFSFTNSTDWARYVPLAHDSGENITDHLAVAEMLWDLLNTGLGVAHNAAFELRHLAKWFRELLSDHPLLGEAVRRRRGYYPVRSDTQVEAYLMAEYQKFGLKALTKSMFGHQMIELFELFEDLPINRRKFLRFNTLEITPRVVEYACEDSVWCLAIHQRYYPQVKERLLYTVEMAVVQTCLPDMEDYGVAYDWALMRRTANELRLFRDRFNAEIMATLSEITGETIAINLASPKQVSEVLFDKLGYRTTVYTDKTRDLPFAQRKMSTGDIALTKLAAQHPVVKMILQWREQTRLLGTYLDKYENLYSYATDGRAHPSHLSAFVITGRFAVADPPYQQSPKKYHFDLAAGKAAHERGELPPPGTCFKFNFRDVITAPAEHYILGFDLSQAELRAIAGEARETALLTAFENGEDVHRLTASLMLGIPLDEVTDEQRNVGKTMNFALLYGMGVKSLADRLGLPIEEAQSLMDKYFAGYPNIATWSAKQIEHGKKYGYVTSKFGRRLPIWEYESDKTYIYQKGDRACVNYPIQGCLPSDTRVLTRAGWAPIGDFTDGDDVWTGAEWAPAMKIDMGVAPRLRLHLSDGRTFDCDDRHRLLVKGEPWPEWKLVTEAKGLPLCQDQNFDWGTADSSSVEDWYWVGRFVGDGALFTNNQGQTVWNLSFDGVKEIDDIQRCRAWLATKPFATARSKTGYSYDDSALRAGRGKGVKLQGVTATAIEFWQAHGITVGTKAKDLRVPPQVFRLDRVRREAFCQGYLDSDGSARYDGRETYWSKLTSASRAGLEDMLRLFQTIGRTGRIGNPVTLKGRGAGGQDYVFWDLWLHRSPAELTIEDITVLDPEPMFTLSVGHPRHAYSSEGLISKNSATGDYMKIAMIRAVAAIKAAGMADKIRLVMNIHDALEFYVHRSVEPQQAIDVLREAVVFAVPGWPQMKADWHIGKRWGSPTEIEVDPNGVVRAVGDKEPDPEPVEEQDPDEVDAALASLVDRTVLVDLPEMPTQETWNAFVQLMVKLPGAHAIKINTPEGHLDLPHTSGLSPAHADQVSRIFGRARVAWQASDVDARDLAAGLTL